MSQLAITIAHAVMMLCKHIVPGLIIGTMMSYSKHINTCFVQSLIMIQLRHAIASDNMIVSEQQPSDWFGQASSLSMSKPSRLAEVLKADSSQTELSCLSHEP